MLRVAANQEGFPGVCSHAGALQSLMRLMTNPAVQMNRLDWIPNDVSVAPKGEFLYFVGCSPFFDTFFDELNVNSLSGVTSAIRLLNRIGISPVVMKDERCCGHDLLWTGDESSFKMLAELNIKRIKDTGAKTIVTNCPECYRTLAIDYPNFGYDHGLKVVHTSEIFADHLESTPLDFQKIDKRVTFQDPCRLGRHMGIYDPPRNILENIPGLEIQEMGKSRNMATCCGTNAWVNCDVNSKQTQLDHLREVLEMECDLLITSCPKCEIHFRCAMNDKTIDEEISVEMMDFASLVDMSLKR
jgi:Fe-S oxidoreductase